MKSFLKNLRAVARFRAARLRTAPASPPVGRIVVVAPHPDDETLGCGGTIFLAAGGRAEVRIVYLSDGEVSLNSWRVPPAQVADRRRSLAVKAASALGIPEERLDFLHLPDGNLPAVGTNDFDDAVRRLTPLLAAHSPECVLCPHPRDGWPDHGSAAAISRAACAKLNPRPVLRHYAVWMWFSSPWGMPGIDWNRASVHDVSAGMEAKRTAIDHYLCDVTSPPGLPWCGRLPWSLPYIARQPAEILLDA